MMKQSAEEKFAVIRRAEYEPPRVLRMDLTNQIPNCMDGTLADIVCSFGAGVGP
jgi:hypothetical protein